MKKIVFRSTFMFLLTAFLLYYILKDNFFESVNLLFSSNILFLLLAILVWFLYFLAEAILLKLLINKHNDKYSLKQSLLLNIMSKFFNGITPFSLGGQPLQVYQLSRDNVKVTDGVLVVTEMFIIHEISLIFLILVSILCKYLFSINPNSFLWGITIFGLIFNSIGLLIAVFVSLKINAAKKIGSGIISFLNKIKIIKNKEKSIEGWYNKCNEYSNGFKDIVNNKKLIFKCIVLNVINFIFYALVPYFIILAIDSSVNINIFYTIILTMLAYVSSTFVPIPGGSVGIEYAYVNYYILFAPENIVLTSLILWRFISYYFPMILGGIIFNIVDNKKARMCKENANNI